MVDDAKKGEDDPSEKPPPLEYPGNAWGGTWDF